MKAMARIVALMVAAMAASSFAQSQTVILQQGLNGYSGCTNQELRNPEINYGNGPKQDILLISEN
jgi:hypothetical protein